MAKIHELSSILADQIAAGEVIERPASVVKELVENAIDAGSREINIIVEEAGLQKIEVTDDGDGISAEEVKMAFRRHATSKISDRKDLFRVHSLGFRGEALPSIASIADVTLVTSTGSAGKQVRVKGGQLLDESVAEARRGTTVTVTDLFYNVPARLKYLKSPTTELAKIVDIVDRLAFGHPSVLISLAHNGREMLRTAGRDDRLQVIGSVYGMGNAKKMVAIQAENTDFKVRGYVSLPVLTRANRNYVSLLLNGRYVKNFILTKALIEGYGSKLMVGRYPVAVIDIEMDPILVDVNVHPTKQEVRLSKEAQLADLITHAVAQALGQQNLIPDGLENLNRGANATVETVAAIQGLGVIDEPATVVQQPELVNSESVPPSVTPSAIEIHDRAGLLSDPVQDFKKRYQNSVVNPFGSDDGSGATPEEPLDDVDNLLEDEKQARFPTLSYIGQFHGTYLVAESADGLYLLDQHAAQERVNYEYYRQVIGEVSSDQQRLLVPVVLDYGTAEMLEIQGHEKLLASVGVHLESFGPNSIVVRQHPTWFKEGQEEATLKEMIDWVLKDGRITVAAFREKTAIMMSCKRAIKANQHLDNRQAKALLAKLKTAENPFNCPHGRPVLVRFTQTDMERMFKRIQDPHESVG